jgi:hypothetical protein
VILTLLQFMPALVLGPLADHLTAGIAAFTLKVARR